MTKYFVEDTLYTDTEPILMRFTDTNFPERYDKHTKKWVVDKKLNRIHIGELLVTEVAETEMNKLINKVI